MGRLAHNRAAAPPKRNRVEEEVQTNESVRSEHIPKRNWSGREKPCLEPKKTETCARDCLRIATRIGEEIERLRQDYK